jgi:sugar phosphate isomerase/epimerase
LDKIQIVHVHDFIPDIGGHQVVGEGIIDFHQILDILCKIPVHPQYVFEVRPRDLAYKSLLAFGKLLEEHDCNL